MTTAITLLNINIALGCIALALNLFVLVYLIITRPRKARKKAGQHKANSSEGVNMKDFYDPLLLEQVGKSIEFRKFNGEEDDGRKGGKH